MRYQNNNVENKDVLKRSLYMSVVYQDAERKVDYYLEEHQKDLVEIIVNEEVVEIEGCKVLIVETINEGDKFPCTMSSSKPMGIYTIPDLYLNTGVMLKEYDDLDYDFVVSNVSGIKSGYTLEKIIKQILDMYYKNEEEL